MSVSVLELQTLGENFDTAPQRSFSLPARAYVQPGYLPVEQEGIFYKSWQYMCHIEQLKKPGDYVAVNIQERPIVVLRNREGELQAF